MSISGPSIETDVEEKFLEYIDHPPIPALPQSYVYDLIIDEVYPEKKSESGKSGRFSWPQGFWNQVYFIICLPLMAL